MKLLFRQRLFSWLDCYDVYDENGNTVFTVEGEVSWGHCLNVLDKNKKEVAKLKEKVLTLFPKFEIYINGEYQGCIEKGFSLFSPVFDIDYNGWRIKGDFCEWDYTIVDQNRNVIATITKELFKWTDTYVLDIKDSADVLGALMLVLAIDAEKCSRN